MSRVKANCKLCAHWHGDRRYCQFAPNMSVLLRIIIRFVGCERYVLNKEITRARKKKEDAVNNRG